MNNVDSDRPDKSRSEEAKRDSVNRGLARRFKLHFLWINNKGLAPQRGPMEETREPEVLPKNRHRHDQGKKGMGQALRRAQAEASVRGNPDANALVNEVVYEDETKHLSVLNLGWWQKRKR